MDRELKRAELAARIKAAFDESDTNETVAFYSQMMREVFEWQREDGPIITHDLIQANIYQDSELNT